MNERKYEELGDDLKKYKGEVLNEKKDGYGNEVVSEKSINEKDPHKLISVYQGMWKDNMYDG